MKLTDKQHLARSRLARALRNLKGYPAGSYGERDALYRDMPEAIEGMIEAMIEARKETG